MISRRAFMSRSAFRPKPPAPGSRRWLIAELDRHTSVAVRRRDLRCVVCGARQGLQSSHFYPRRHRAVRFDLRNCHAMCAGCNRRHNADPSPYLSYMLERYGPEAVAELGALRAGAGEVSDEELRRLLRMYRQ